MGPTVINGLPAHVLLVHVVVVLVPLTALALVVCAVWPAWISRLGLVLPVLALVSLVSVPLTTHAGEWLEHRVNRTALVRRHAELGDGLLPWAVGLFLLAVAFWWFGRKGTGRAAPDADMPRGVVSVSLPVRVTAVALTLIVGAGAVVQVYRIGDSGAKAAWGDGYSAASGHVAG
ncbi:hypothetical protein C8250_041925 [Streptomyces sp. So13.3]|uniref:DUF2231 domain-containing protein n=1 Tax=Streptomyces TaxID=1883 RepID=UPI001105D7CA|nr:MULTISPECIES: DUF2231 domain-containing protein [unclassified Streptomyces]MCZ4102142.1 hypothetical protein [Streptomyces sp. H39-C1]QNA77497.1 hypothetical protein C8250_041925 [Streptomyces sp. So13.3]